MSSPRIATLPTQLNLSCCEVQVGASPLRVIVLPEGQGGSSPTLRFGHAVANNDNPTVARYVTHIADLSTEQARGNRRGKGCAGALRAKAQSISNAFRLAVGLPIVESSGAQPQTETKMYHIMPFIGTPPTFVELKSNGLEGTAKGGEHVIVPHHRHGHHTHIQHHIQQESFLMRIHNALMALGPWEGRAVAFVLGTSFYIRLIAHQDSVLTVIIGCGMGTLLRMLWVLVIVLFRSVKGRKEDGSGEYNHILFEQDGDAEGILVAPPTYTYVDGQGPVVPLIYGDATDIKVAPEETK